MLGCPGHRRRLVTYDAVRDFASTYAQVINALIERAGEVWGRAGMSGVAHDEQDARQADSLASVTRSFMLVIAKVSDRTWLATRKSLRRAGLRAI